MDSLGSPKLSWERFFCRKRSIKADGAPLRPVPLHLQKIPQDLSYLAPRSVACSVPSGQTSPLALDAVEQAVVLRLLDIGTVGGIGV